MATTWNYRVVKLDDTYGIHETYYNQGEHLPHTISETPVGPIGHTPEQLAAEFEKMKAALTRPVLDYDTLEEI